MVSWLALWLREVSTRIAVCLVSILSVIIIILFIHSTWPEISHFTAIDIYFYFCLLAYILISWTTISRSSNMNYQLQMLVYLRKKRDFYLVTVYSLPNILSLSLWIEKHQVLVRWDTSMRGSGPNFWVRVMTIGCIEGSSMNWTSWCEGPTRVCWRRSCTEGSLELDQSLLSLVLTCS